MPLSPFSSAWPHVNGGNAILYAANLSTTTNFPNPNFSLSPTAAATNDTGATATATAFSSAGLLVGMADGSGRLLTSSVLTTGVVTGYPTVSIWSWACAGPLNPISSAPTPSGW